MAHKPSLKGYLRSVWLLLQNGSFFAVVVFSLVYTGVGGVSTPAGVMVKRYWAGVQNLQNQVRRPTATGATAALCRPSCAAPGRLCCCHFPTPLESTSIRHPLSVARHR